MNRTIAALAVCLLAALIGVSAANADGPDLSGTYHLVGPAPDGSGQVPIVLELVARDDGSYAVTHTHVLGAGRADVVLRGNGRAQGGVIVAELAGVVGASSRVRRLLEEDAAPTSGTARFVVNPDSGLARGQLRIGGRTLAERGRPNAAHAGFGAPAPRVDPGATPRGFAPRGRSLRDVLPPRIARRPAVTTPDPIVVAKDEEPDVPIRDHADAISTIEVTDEGTIESLATNVDIQHTWRGDLTVTLTAPDGTSVRLHDRAGRSADDIVGAFPADLTPVDDLAAFAGKEAKGTWTLAVHDHAFQDQGVIRGWGLTITPEAGEEPPPPPPPAEIPEFATEIPSREVFEGMSRRDNVPGAMGVREVKFLVTGVGSDSPQLYFINTNEFEFHYDFASRGLGLTLSLRRFNQLTYFTDNRQFIAGSIIAHDAFEHPDTGKGIYTVEFWPTDPVKVHHVDIPYHQVVAGMPFASEKIYYHPASETQKALHAQTREEFDRRRIKVIGTEELFGNVTYSPLNLGEGYGLLRVVDEADPRPPSVRDIVIFKNLPNDLSHVAGVMTEVPQTPLSHINLKAKQNDTPNAYIKNASTHERIAPLVGKWVHYVVAPDDFTVEEATQAEVEEFLEALRPTEEQIPTRDLDVNEVANLGDIGNGDTRSVGAKAANLGELRDILPEGVVPDGFAVPFAFYDAFMRFNERPVGEGDAAFDGDGDGQIDLYEETNKMAAAPDFRADPAIREDRLKEFRKVIKKESKSTMPPDVLAKLERMHQDFIARFGPDQPIRLRSSTNNEDLEGFNGAGLYDSKTHRADEGHIQKTVRQVWASLWNYRAFEERDFYRIPHDQAAMGIAAHPNFDDEIANGVAVTKNIYDPNWPGFYVNVQAGESLVTNPDAGVTPDEFLVARLGPRGEYEIQFIRHSTLLPEGQATIMTEAQTNELVQYMERIQSHFARVYDRENDPTFAMDIEFKVTVDNRLVIKQARPWID